MIPSLTKHWHGVHTIAIGRRQLIHFLRQTRWGLPRNTSDLLNIAFDAAAAARDMSDMGRRPQDALVQQQNMNLLKLAASARSSQC